MDHETVLRLFAEYVHVEIKNACINAESQPMCHNHPPVRAIVHDCPYCALFGNVVFNMKTASS